MHTLKLMSGDANAKSVPLTRHSQPNILKHGSFQNILSFSSSSPSPSLSFLLFLPLSHCVSLSASSNAFFPLGFLPRQRHHFPLPMSPTEICRSKNILPLYPNIKNAVLGPGKALFFFFFFMLLPFLLSGEQKEARKCM